MENIFKSKLYNLVKNYDNLLKINRYLISLSRYEKKLRNIKNTIELKKRNYIIESPREGLKILYSIQKGHLEDIGGVSLGRLPELKIKSLKEDLENVLNKDFRISLRDLEEMLVSIQRNPKLLESIEKYMIIKGGNNKRNHVKYTIREFEGYIKRLYDIHMKRFLKEVEYLLEKERGYTRAIIELRKKIEKRKRFLNSWEPTSIVFQTKEYITRLQEEIEKYLKEISENSKDINDLESILDKMQRYGLLASEIRENKRIYNLLNNILREEMQVLYRTSLIIESFQKGVENANRKYMIGVPILYAFFIAELFLSGLYKDPLLSLGALGIVTVIVLLGKKVLEFAKSPYNPFIRSIMEEHKRYIPIIKYEILMRKFRINALEKKIAENCIEIEEVARILGKINQKGEKEIVEAIRKIKEFH